MLERKRKIAIRLLITGSEVRFPHNPLGFVLQNESLHKFQALFTLTKVKSSSPPTGKLGGELLLFTYPLIYFLGSLLRSISAGRSTPSIA